MLSGMIVDHGGYFMLEIFFIGWLSSKLKTKKKEKTKNLIEGHFFKYFCLNFSVALIATVVIWLYDTNTKGNLNMTPSEREQYTNSM